VLWIAFGVVSVMAAWIALWKPSFAQGTGWTIAAAAWIASFALLLVGALRDRIKSDDF
jgi:hypothetical protein